MLLVGFVQMVADCGKTKKNNHVSLIPLDTAASCGGFPYVVLVPKIFK